MKFEVYKNGKLADKIQLTGAYLFGVDGIPFRLNSKVAFRNGLVECHKRSPEAAGLTLLWPVQEFGEIMLSTTRLRERDRPYNLNVELARGKLMEITTKREDWAVFETDADLTETGRQAQTLFIESLQHISDPPRAAQLADQSLQKALVFAEGLANNHADFLFDNKQSTSGLGRHCLGCRISPRLIGHKAYLERLLGTFAYVTVPVNWAQIEPRRGAYDFSSIDVCIKALARKRVAVCAGPLLRFSKDYLPEWLTAGDTGFEQIREAAYEFISGIVNRYANRVHAWRLISGLNALNHFRFSFGQILEMTRAATLAAKAANAKSLKMVEVICPWGEYYATSADTIPPLVYVDMVTQSGITHDALGLELAFGKDSPGLHVRDLMQISAMLDRFAVANKSLHIVALAVPDKPPENPPRGGIWHQQWNQNIQADLVESFYKIALSKPFVDTVTYSALSDNDPAPIPSSGLLNKKLEPKKAYKSLQNLQQAILKH